MRLSCASEPPLTISADDDSISVTATLIDEGVRIENTGDIDCIVFVIAPEGRQQFELDVGESATVTEITRPIEVAAVKQ